MEKNYSRNFRDEYKKVDRLFNIFEKLHNKKKSNKSICEFNSRWFKRFSYNEEKVKDGTIQAKLSPSSVSQNGAIDRRE